jgi:hypothetical protein
LLFCPVYVIFLTAIWAFLVVLFWCPRGPRLKMPLFFVIALL